MPALQKSPMLTPAQHQRLNRLRRTAFAVVGGAYSLKETCCRYLGDL